MWTDCLTSIIHVLKLNGYKGRQAKVGEKRQCFKGWESLVKNLLESNIFYIFATSNQLNNI